MTENGTDIQYIVDFATGKEIPLMGPEENRQSVEKYLVNEKGYDKADIKIDLGFSFVVKDEPYHARLDLVADAGGIHFMVIKCVAGSLGSYEREALAAARLFCDYQIPFALVSDGKNAIVLDTLSGKKNGRTLADIPSKQSAAGFILDYSPTPFPEARREKEGLIFRTYDCMNVNSSRP